MAKTYFVYSQNNTPTVGGVTPQGVEIGIGNYQNIHAGSCLDPLALLDISEFNPIICSQDAAEGLNLIGVTKTTSFDNTGTEVSKPLTAAQKRKQAAADSLVKKLRIRFNIASNLGDAGDLIADLSKRLSLLERITMLSLNELLNATPMSAVDSAVIKTQIDNYLSDLATGKLKDQIDLEDPVTLAAKLRSRLNSVVTAVTTA